MTYNCFASCSFGLESILSSELKKLKFANVSAKVARVYFDADEAGIARANIGLRTADRVYIELAQFEATTFDSLFEQVGAVRWEDFIDQKAQFPVDADSVRSQLFSVSDIQSICKKAIVDRLTRKYKGSLPETGKRYNVHIKVLRDRVSACLNTSGAGLNRRGYRVSNVKAPIRETLAAGLVMISGWKGGALADPMCGSGTIAIEAALMAAGIPPGMNRSFDAQHWDGFEKQWREVHDAAQSINAQPYEVYASDVDKRAVSAASRNAEAAGVDLKIYHADVRDFQRSGCAVLTNPPYAARLGDKNEVHALYRDMGKAFSQNQRKYIISADQDFERHFGKRASKCRKLYNGNIRCTFYQYF